VLSFAPALKLTLGRLDVVRLYLAAPFKPYVAKSKLAQPSSADGLWRGYPVNPLKGTIELLRLQHAVRPRLSLVRQPILIVQGRGDQTVHPSAPETIYREVGSTVKELRWFDHSEHKVILDDERDQVFALTLAFLEKALSLKQMDSF